MTATFTHQLALEDNNLVLYPLGPQYDRVVIQHSQYAFAVLDRKGTLEVAFHGGHDLLLTGIKAAGYEISKNTNVFLVTLASVTGDDCRLLMIDAKSIDLVMRVNHSDLVSVQVLEHEKKRRGRSAPRDLYHPDFPHEVFVFTKNNGSIYALKTATKEGAERYYNWMTNLQATGKAEPSKVVSPTAVVLSFDVPNVE